MNDAVWFALLNGQKEGPFTAQQLRHDYRVTPDTLICKESWPEWIPLRDIVELQFIFKDEKTQEELLPLKKKVSQAGKEEIVLDIQKEPMPIFFWIILLIVFVYLIYEFQYYFS